MGGWYCNRDIDGHQRRRMVMGKNAAEGNRKKGKIAEEIRKRIGRSVLIAYIVVEVSL